MMSGRGRRRCRCRRRLVRERWREAARQLDIRNVEMMALEKETDGGCGCLSWVQQSARID